MAGLRLLTLAFVVAAVYGAPAEDKESRIINGKPAAANQFPFIVSLQVDLNPGPVLKFCGGSIVNKNWIISAAHCFAQPIPGIMYIVAGTTDAYDFEKGQTIDIAKIIKHADYDGEANVNDIALLKLAKPLEFNPSVQPIELAPSNYNAEASGMGQIIGWGAIHPVQHDIGTKNLRWTDISVVSQNTCQEVFPNVGEGQVCVWNKGYLSGPCVGDSGGPFIQKVGGKPILVGLTSYAVSVCAITPTVYTRVSYFNDWVKTTIANN